MHYHEVSVTEYDQLMLDYKRGDYKIHIRSGEFSLAEVHSIFEKSKSDPTVQAFRAGQCKGVADNLATKKRL